jgi:hypothetical protein
MKTHLRKSLKQHLIDDGLDQEGDPSVVLTRDPYIALPFTSIEDYLYYVDKRELGEITGMSQYLTKKAHIEKFIDMVDEGKAGININFTKL